MVRLYLTIFCLLSLWCTAALPAQEALTPEAMHTLAQQLLETDQFENAVDAFEALIVQYPEHPLVQNACFSVAGIYAVFLQSPAEALPYYRRVTENYLETSPLVQRAYANMGKIYVELGQGEEAYQCLNKIRPESPLYEESRSLATWMSTRFRRTIYWNGREMLIIISILEIGFVITWVFLGKVDALHESIRNRLFWKLWAILLVFLLLKGYFNYTLFTMGG